jgi:hypothetical protein
MIDAATVRAGLMPLDLLQRLGVDHPVVIDVQAWLDELGEVA